MADGLTLTARALRISVRQVDAVVTALVLPVLLMVLFVELFGGAIRTGGDYVDYVVPGVLVLCSGFGAGTTAVSVSADVTGGMIDRLRSLDVRGPALLGGHVAASVVRNVASTALVIAVALTLGFRPHAGALDWLAVAGLLLAFVAAMAWLSSALGLVARSPEAASGLTFVVMFVPYASSAFVPVGTMPSWLQGFAAHQPVTPLVDALRALLLGHSAGADPVIALAWCGAIVAVSVPVTAVLFARRGRRR